MIVAGEVLVAPADGVERRLEEGDFFGEMALVSREPRTATVVAASTVDLLVIEATDFARLCDRLPVIRDKVQTVARARQATRVWTRDRRHPGGGARSAPVFSRRYRAPR